MCFLVLSSFAQVQNATFTITPSTFEATDEITITVSNIDVSLWNVTDIYLWAWYFDVNDNLAGDSPTNGTWTQSNDVQKFINNGNGTFSYTFIPANLYGTSNIGRIGMLAKARDGSNMGNGERKTQDNFAEVGIFQATLISPSAENTIVNAGSNLAISATSSVNANFELFGNGISLISQNNITNFSNIQVINTDTYFQLVITEPSSGNQIIKPFNVILTPNPQIASVPSGMKDGLNYNINNPNEVTLVLYAPFKNYVHVKGNFNNNDWRLTNTFLMKKDDAQNRFWITLSGLNVENNNFLYQYVVDATITVADPYSTLILSDFDDQFINQETFPDIPAYPSDKTEFAISWFKLNQAPYVWQVQNFERPKTTDLVIYELLIRDFDALHSYQAVIDKLDYLQNLGINAIELMPVNEFDGNISWGYNSAFHMASDKYYGTQNKLKELIDACHERGIAVILDVVYNHATGQNPYYRMWNTCNGCFGGQASNENPFFNPVDPNTTFSFFNDINHESGATKDYIDRLNAFWLTEFNLDGFRFDFTKGFTNVVGDGGNFDASRIAILKRMYDQLRAVDDNAYVILEHFAPNSEETQLIEHRATNNPNEQGMIVWSNHNYNYNEATMGYNSNSNFSGISYLNRGWTTPSAVGYMESHDEERLNYKNQAFGNGNSNYDTKNFETAMDRMELAGAFFFTVPGPKSMWQFGELGYDFSINRCQDGTISEDCRTDPKPIVWDLGYNNNTARVGIYETWSKLIRIKKSEPIFETSTFTMDVANSNGIKKIQLTNPTASGSEIKYVTILGNFGIIEQNITPSFQETGSWFNMLDDTQITVTDPNATILLQPGQFFVYANEFSVLQTPQFDAEAIALFPNPTSTIFRINKDLDSINVFDISGKLVGSFENYKLMEEINVSPYSKGVYLIKASSNGQIYNLKLLIK